MRTFWIQFLLLLALLKKLPILNLQFHNQALHRTNFMNKTMNNINKRWINEYLCCKMCRKLQTESSSCFFNDSIIASKSKIFLINCNFSAFVVLTKAEWDSFMVKSSLNRITNQKRNKIIIKLKCKFTKAATTKR